MSLEHGKLCYLLLAEHFGEVVGKVAENLQWAPKPLSYIVMSTGISVSKVKKALSVLIQYGFVLFRKGVKVSWVAEYELLHEKILLILRYPKYLTLIKNKFGIEEQLLLQEILKHGTIVGSKAILNVYKAVKGDSEFQSTTLITLRNSLHNLISNNFLMRCAYPSPQEQNQEDCNNVPTLVVSESELYKSPEINMKILSEIEAGTSNTDDPGDKSVYWKPYFDRFNQELRDEVMINAIRRRFDDNAAELMKYLLQLNYLRTEPWAADSNPVPIIELKDLITKKSGNQYLIQYFEQYLKIMDEDSCKFISKTGESSSSQVIVNMSGAFYQLTLTAIENIIDQRYGSKASRIFRLIYAKKYIEQEQIQQSAMITDKEAKQITYKLLQENYIQMQELKKPTIGNKSFFLFHVDMNLVVSMVTGSCHKAILNVLYRRQSETNEYKRLIEKHERIEGLIQTMRESGEASEEQLNEYIEEWIPPPEKTLLESVEKMVEKLKLAEIQTDTTLFLLQLFSYYQVATMPKVTTGKK